LPERDPRVRLKCWTATGIVSRLTRVFDSKLEDRVAKFPTEDDWVPVARVEGVGGVHRVGGTPSRPGWRANSDARKPWVDSQTVWSVGEECGWTGAQ